jgi:hypothetical protein
MFFIYSFLISEMNSIDPSEISNFPNYLLIFGLHFAFPLALSTMVTVIFYAKNATLRETLLEKVKELMNI